MQNENLVCVLLARGANPDAKNSIGRTAAHSRIAEDEYDTGKDKTSQVTDRMLSLLVSHSADLNVRDVDGMTPLFLAIRHSMLSLLRGFLKGGADVNVTSEEGKTAIVEAPDFENFEAVDLLLEYGSHLEMNTETFGPLMQTIHQFRGWFDNRNSAFYKMDNFHNWASLFDTKTHHRIETPEEYALFYSIDKRMPSLAKFLLENGVSPNFHLAFHCDAIHDKWTTALHLAACMAMNDVTSLILQQGVSTNVTDSLNRTPLHYAASAIYHIYWCTRHSLKFDDIDIPIFSREAVEDLNLMRISKTKLAAQLIRSGASVLATDVNLKTPLYWAAKYLNRSLCEFLVTEAWSNGACDYVDMESRSEREGTAVKYALDSGERMIKVVKAEVSLLDGLYYSKLELGEWIGDIEGYIKLALDLNGAFGRRTHQNQTSQRRAV